MLQEGKIENTNIKLQIVEDRNEISRHFARAIADIIKTNNALRKPTRLIMPVGPTGQYLIFANICKTELIDLSNLHMFNMDEYVGSDGHNLPTDHPFSFSCFLRENFYNIIDSKCNLNLDQMHVPDAKNPSAYKKAISDIGEIDICFGGIGINGHIAFNEALDYWELMSNEDFKNLTTRVVKLATTTKVVNSIFGAGGDMKAIPNFAVTIGMKEIFASNKICIYLDWFWQKQVLRNTISGPVTPMFPASFLQEHPDVTITITKCVAEEPSLKPE